MDYSTDPVRAQGPSAVTEGTPDGPIVLVLDPAGAARHEGLPATWRDLEQRWRIVWCRLPADGSLSQADDILADPPAAGKVVHMVASGPYAEEAMRLADRHARSVRSVLLVDPAARGFVAPGDGPAANEHWEEDTEKQRWELTREGIDVRTIAHSEGGESDRIPAPLPLGHPDVVSGVQNAISELGATK
ncbi:hypothetical protein HFP15_12225 [Amycolatopsis sp. K13G38]|uniref:Alpha/beta hydrolase n=1 Tax=Amycolatopsis acididurans TaxID=2724524 RepID=A0ABX1J5N8_9PSEU|nr:hypothetical protein [Amycolatopsis acididurans]NKQ53645.1 hypothetical protein [Amycolatopsis acididurans]